MRRESAIFDKTTENPPKFQIGAPIICQEFTDFRAKSLGITRVNPGYQINSSHVIGCWPEHSKSPQSSHPGRSAKCALRLT